MIPTELTLDAVNSSLRDIYAKLKPLHASGAVNLSGQRITNAGASIDLNDGVTSIELFVDDPLTFDVNAFLGR